MKSEPRDPQKPKIYEKTIALDPTRPRESTKKVCFDPVKVGRIYSIIYNIINCIIYYMKYNRKRNRYSKIIYNHIGNMQTIPKQQIGGAGAKRPPPQNAAEGGVFVVLVWFAYFLYGCI